MPIRMAAVLSFVVSALGAVTSPALAESQYREAQGLIARIEQPSSLELRVDYAPPPNATIAKVTARAGAVALPVPRQARYPADGQITAIYLLIDTSDPRRRRDVEQAVLHVKAMLKAAGPHHRFGLATFDSALNERLPLGPKASAVDAKLGGIRAIGQRTFFFEAGIEAVKRLQAFQADRRALFIFSDGKIEDVKTAFDSGDLIAAAKRARVRIYGLGYSRSAVEPRAFQNLRGPARATGGLFVKTDRQLQLPAAFLAAPYAAIDRGGRAVFDLTPARSTGLGGRQPVEIAFTGENGRRFAVSAIATLPPLPFTGRAKRLFERAQQRENLPWSIGALVCLLLVLAGLVWAVRVLLRRWRASRLRGPPIAFLEFLDDAAAKVDMVRAAMRIGRNPDNDVALSNDSISAYHAEIHRKRDGTFLITDLDSMNGVFVNNKPVKMAELSDGDEIDLGEIRIRFLVNSNA